MKKYNQRIRPRREESIKMLDSVHLEKFVLIR